MGANWWLALVLDQYLRQHPELRAEVMAHGENMIQTAIEDSKAIVRRYLKPGTPPEVIAKMEAAIERDVRQAFADEAARRFGPTS